MPSLDVQLLLHNPLKERVKFFVQYRDMKRVFGLESRHQPNVIFGSAERKEVFSSMTLRYWRQAL
jgi:hypothetical protein